MNLEKAIEIETIHNDHNPNFTDAEREEAHQLGIEALRRVILYRKGMYIGLGDKMPGETDD